MNEERRFRYFETEDEQTQKYRARSMSFSPEQSDIEDDRIAIKTFQDLMKVLDYGTRIFMTPELRNSIKKRCKQSSKYTEGIYEIFLIGYEDLCYAYENKACIPIGFKSKCVPSKSAVLAVADDKYRVISFYIPKSGRQEQIQNAIDNAIFNLEKRLERKGMCPRKDVSIAIEEFLWMQKYPKKIPQIRIFGVPNRLPVDRNTVSLRLEGMDYIQMRYNPLDNVVQYHIE